MGAIADACDWFESCSEMFCCFAVLLCSAGSRLVSGKTEAVLEHGSAMKSPEMKETIVEGS